MARGGAGRRVSHGDLLEPHDGGAAHLERRQHRVAASVCVGVHVPAARSLRGGGSGIAGGVTCAAPWDNFGVNFTSRFIVGYAVYRDNRGVNE